jgi:hypothetical protein
MILAFTKHVWGQTQLVGPFGDLQCERIQGDNTTYMGNMFNCSDFACKIIHV